MRDMSDMMKPSRRWTGDPGKRQNPVGASLTEKIVSASTQDADIASYERMKASRPLKPPRRKP
jgi:hypothetical protein